MPAVGFSHYNLRAPRPMLDALRDFYRDVVGLEVGARPAFASFGYWLYAGADDVLHLTESRPGEQRGSPATTTFDHAAFLCSDRADHERRLAARGIEFRVARVPGSGRVQLFFKDPAGNGVELDFDAEETYPPA